MARGIIGVVMVPWFPWFLEFVPGFPGVVPGNLGLITGYQVGGPEYLAGVRGYLSLSHVT